MLLFTVDEDVITKSLSTKDLKNFFCHTILGYASVLWQLLH